MCIELILKVFDKNSNNAVHFSEENDFLFFSQMSILIQAKQIQHQLGHS